MTIAIAVKTIPPADSLSQLKAAAIALRNVRRPSSIIKLSGENREQYLRAKATLGL